MADPPLYAALLLIQLNFAIGAVVAALALPKTEPLTFALIREVCAACLLTAYAVKQGEPAVPPRGSRAGSCALLFLAGPVAALQWYGHRRGTPSTRRFGSTTTVSRAGRGRAPLDSTGAPAAWDSETGVWVGVAKKTKPDGVPKPRGRAPLGAEWNYETGEWEGGAKTSAKKKK